MERSFVFIVSHQNTFYLFGLEKVRDVLLDFCRNLSEGWNHLDTSWLNRPIFESFRSFDGLTCLLSCPIGSSNSQWWRPIFLNWRSFALDFTSVHQLRVFSVHPSTLQSWRFFQDISNSWRKSPLCSQLWRFASAFQGHWH